MFSYVLQWLKIWVVILTLFIVLILWLINFWLLLSLYNILCYIKFENLLLKLKFTRSFVSQNSTGECFTRHFCVLNLSVMDFCMLILVWVSNDDILVRSTWKHGPLCAVWKQCWKTWICSWDLCKSLLALLWSVSDWKFLFWLELSCTMVFIP